MLELFLGLISLALFSTHLYDLHLQRTVGSGTSHGSRG